MSFSFSSVTSLRMRLYIMNAMHYGTVNHWVNESWLHAFCVVLYGVALLLSSDCRMPVFLDSF